MRGDGSTVEDDGGLRTIGEAAAALNVPQHVLRFWETRFPQVKPIKRAGGRRSYGREDLALLRVIRDLLYGEGYTIKGVQRLLCDQGVQAFGVGSSDPVGEARPTSAPRPTSMRPKVADLSPLEARLGSVLSDLVECRRILEQARDGSR